MANQTYRGSCHYPRSAMALEDAQRTLGLVRFHAAEWNIDPHKIGVLEFSKHSLVCYAALKKAKVPVEMHLYAHGGHAFGLRRTELPKSGWPQLVKTWLATIGMI